MCLSDVARIVDHDPATYDALVEIDGRSANVSTIALGLDCPGLAAGDWIVVHTGLAVERLTAEEAGEILRFRTVLAPSTSKEHR
ncbi:MAG: HypC/HybG/HupF family hydrogenase formation chaperone [Acidimicrobiia bacterium]|nr:HypC/HybG/HupF family hydrogenase formation chaperone [Acidimicrobiia bacterium]